MTSFSYGDIFDSNSQTINIHDLNLINNVRRGKVSFNSLSQLQKILCNIDENNRSEYLENGISINEENYHKNILSGVNEQTLFTLPTNDVIYLSNHEQNTFTLDLKLDGSMLIGQFAKLNDIELEISGIVIDKIENININIINWDITHSNNIIKIKSSDLHFSPDIDQVYNLLRITYAKPIENWNKRCNISNMIIKSYLVDHYALNNKVLIVPSISGGDIYSYESINYLASHGYINDTIRIKPVNHSQQDNMFIVYKIENVNLKAGDIIFVVDDNLFGQTDKLKLRNYLCGWHEITDSNINNVKYIAVYIDYNQETGNTISNVDYKYKFYDSNDNTIYDLESQEGNTYKSLGYGSVKNPLILTKSNVSVINDEINGLNIYDLLLNYL